MTRYTGLHLRPDREGNRRALPGPSLPLLGLLLLALVGAAAVWGLLGHRAPHVRHEGAPPGASSAAAVTGARGTGPPPEGAMTPAPGRTPDRAPTGTASGLRPMPAGTAVREDPQAPAPWRGDAPGDGPGAAPAGPPERPAAPASPAASGEPAAPAAVPEVPAAPVPPSVPTLPTRQRPAASCHGLLTILLKPLLGC